MRSKFLYLILLAIFCCNARADQYLFKVFYVKGDVLLHQNSKNISLVKDHLIYSGDEIILEEKSTVVLLDNENKPLVIEQVGIYSTKKIERLFENIDQDNLTQKYFSYVVEEFMQHHGEKVYTGAVSRGDEMSILRPEDSCIIMSQQLHFEWKNPEFKKCWLFIYSTAGKRLYESQVMDSQLMFDLDQTVLKKGETYLWMVSLNQYPLKDDLLNVITIASDQQIHDYENKLKIINERFDDKNFREDSETKLLLMYGFFRMNRLFDEALKIKKVILDNFPNSNMFNDW
ncbi:MAG: hypothetical protein ISR55_02810 [Bacteroidetes bacterium]|nr:hypothetical protein [Bacteroidota bacterium]